MKTKFIVITALLFSAAAWAHHSFSIFDNTHTVTLTGVIKEFQWTNPHTFTWIDVPDGKGGTTTWGIEGMSPNYLGRRGWSKTSLKTGDKISITIFPMKDATQKGGTFLRCIMPDGTEKVMFDIKPNAPLPQ